MPGEILKIERAIAFIGHEFSRRRENELLPLKMFTELRQRDLYEEVLCNHYRT
jgi:hypothetical protein